MKTLGEIVAVGRVVAAVQQEIIRIKGIGSAKGLLFILIALCSCSLESNWLPNLSKNEKLAVLLNERLTSLDPLTFDFEHHYPVQSLLNIKLFSNYANSTISPQLVKSWRSTKSDTEWFFKIRDDLFFSDGTRISSHDVVNSLVRVAYIIKKSGSKNNFIENLKNINSLHSIRQLGFKGIELLDDEVVIRLNKPLPTLLEVLSFGMYAVVSEKNYDKKSGKWIDGKLSDYVSSGPYEVFSADETEFTVSLRKNIPPGISDPKAFKFIAFVGRKNAAANVDITVDAADSLRYGEGYRFYSQGESSIGYFVCHPWSLSSSPLSNKSIRVELRKRLFSHLSKKSGQKSRSFFPLLMPGIQEPGSDAISGAVTKGFLSKNREISFDDGRPFSSRASEYPLEALEIALKESGFVPVSTRIKSYEELAENLDPLRRFYGVDIGYYVTGISFSDPSGDIAFMFSKEGVRLPDPTGRIRKEISKENFSPQKVNELIFDDAIIWPVRHFSVGIWAKSNLDLTSYNVLLPMAELQWIRRR